MQNWFKTTQSKRSIPESLTSDLFSSLMVMAWFVEAKDPYTGGHLWRVSEYARALAHAGKLPESDVARIALGGFLHDLGKIAISENVLRKTGKLNDAEFAEIKSHPEVGGRLLSGHPLARLVAVSVELHHERPDGQGYPYQLSGSMIPVDAAIVGLCDAFDAMTSQRPYRKPMTKDKAVAIINAHLDTQFNRYWGELFISLVESGAVDDILGHSDDGIPLHDCKRCGPVVVQHSEQTAGDYIYCPVCQREMNLVEGQAHEHLVARPTGKKGIPAHHHHHVDRAMIRKMIERSVAALPKSLLFDGLVENR